MHDVLGDGAGERLAPLLHAHLRNVGLPAGAAICGVRRRARVQGKRYVPVAPEIVDSADERWAFFCFQPLAHWDGDVLLFPLTPRCLRRILNAKVPSTVGLLPMEAGCPRDTQSSEASRDELQAGGTGWVRAIWVAARQGRGRGC